MVWPSHSPENALGTGRVPKKSAGRLAVKGLLPPAFSTDRGIGANNGARRVTRRVAQLEGSRVFIYKIILFTPLRRRLLEVLEERRPLLVLLDAGEDHLRALDELLRVREPLVHRLVVPRHAAPRHGAAEGEARRRAGRAAEDAVQVRALLVRAAGLDRVALAAPAYGARMVSRSLRSLLSASQNVFRPRDCGAAAALGLEDLRALVALAHWSPLLFVP